MRIPMILGAVCLSGCAYVTDYTPLTAPSTGLQYSGLHIEGIPRAADSDLNSTELTTLNLIRASNSFSLIFRSRGNPSRVYIDGVSTPWENISGYKVVDIPRSTCRPTIDYRITAKILFSQDTETGQIDVRPGVYVERKSIVDYVAPGANNVRDLAFYSNENVEGKVWQYFHDSTDVAKLAIRTVNYNPDIDVLVKSASDANWQTLGPFAATGWKEFDLACGQFFLIKVQRNISNPAPSVTERVDVSIVGSDGRYGQGYVFDVTSVGNPP